MTFAFLKAFYGFILYLEGKKKQKNKKTKTQLALHGLKDST